MATESEREKSDHEDDDEDEDEEPQGKDEKPEERDQPESDQESEHEPEEKARKAPPPTVLPKPKSRSKDLDLPEFVSSFDDRTVEEGNLVRMDCEIRSGSEVLVEWLIDNELISSEAFSHFTLINDGDLYSLLIAETRLADSALYTCSATNEAGTTKCTADLTVTGV